MSITNSDEFVVDRISGLLNDDGSEIEGGSPEGEEHEEALQAEEATSEEVKAEEDVKAEGEEEASEEEEPGDGSITLAQLAEALELEPADLYGVKIPVQTADGRKEISLGEWKDVYQQSVQAQQQAGRLAETYNAGQARLQAQQQQLFQRMQEADAIAQAVEQQLYAGYQGLEELKDIDPTEYVIKSQELRERQNQVRQYRQMMGARAQSMQQEAQAKQAYMLQQQLQHEAPRLPQIIPAWKDGDTAAREKAELARYLLSQGYSQEEAGSLYDSRAVGIAYKAWKYDQAHNAKPEAKKTLKIGSKVLRPGSPRSKAQAAGDKIAKLRQAFRRGGGKDMNTLTDMIEQSLG